MVSFKQFCWMGWWVTQWFRTKWLAVDNAREYLTKISEISCSSHMHVSYLPGFTPNLGDYDGFSKPPRLLAGLCSSRVVLSHSIALAFNPFLCLWHLQEQFWLKTGLVDIGMIINYGIVKVFNIVLKRKEISGTQVLYF